MYNESILKGFCKDYSLPIQIYDPEYVLYYIDLYDPIYNTKEKFKLFADTVTALGSMNAFEAYKSNLKNSIIDSVKSTIAYMKLNDDDLDIDYPIKKDVHGINYSKTVNIYTPKNVGQHMLSIDLRKANFQALQRYDKEIVLDTDTYEQLIQKFSPYKYFADSKYIRQYIFGNLNMNRITRIERWITQTLLDYLLASKRFDTSDIITFTTDEIIIKLNEFITPSNCQELEQHIKEQLAIDVKVESFRLDYLGNSFYIKTHYDDITPTFKGGSSVYFAQAFKHYLTTYQNKNLSLTDKDLCFSYEGQIVQFIEPLKWNE